MLNNTVMEMFMSALGATGEKGEEQKIVLGDGTELNRSTFPVDESSVTLDIIPEALRERFLFRSHLAVLPGRNFQGSSVAIAVFPMRLDDRGNMIPCSPSIKNAAWGHVSKNNVLPCGDINENAVVKPDLYLQADCYGVGGLNVFMPSMLKRPFPATDGAVSLMLHPSNSKDPQRAEKHNASRELFRELMAELANELGVPTGEQFLVCMVCFPVGAKAFKGKRGESGEEGNPFYGVSLSGGGYIVGGCKVGGGQKLPEQLSGLRLSSDFVVGNKPLKDRMLEELVAARSRSVTPPATTPAAVQAPVQSSIPASVQTPVRPVPVPVAATPPQPVVEPKKEEVVEAKAETKPQSKAASILGKLGMMQSDSDGDFNLIPIEVEEATVTATEDAEVEVEVEEQPVVRKTFNFGKNLLK